MPPSFEAYKPISADRDVAVLMSGGVDSSTTALVLKEQGWNVLGITMKLPVAKECVQPAPCCGGRAAVVAHNLGVAHYFLDAAAVFNRHVIERFRNSYARGLTPNPCADCNQFLKFGAVWDLLEQEFGIQYLATGHYAQIVHENDGYFLKRGVDRRRDQSYFIYGVPPRRVPYLILPMGSMNGKDDVRARAAEASLPVADRPDSMELCFAGEGDYRNALGHVAEENEGPILDTAGNRLGTHSGVWNYTIGQRRGLGIATGEPMYVVAINPVKNSVTVGPRDEAFRREVVAYHLNVLQPDRIILGAEFEAKIRSYNKPAPCHITNFSPNSVHVKFREPQFAPAPGQRLVLYDREGRVVCGGEISRD